MMTHVLSEMTRTEAAQCLARAPIAFLPLGAVEQHGGHLPLGTDLFLAEEYAKRIAERVDGVVLPSIPFGYSWVWQDIPGTITVGHRVLEDFLTEVIKSAERSGFAMLVLVDGHESNTTTMKYVARDYLEHSDFPVLRLFYPRLTEIREESCVSPTWHGMIHACEFETSLLLDVRPDLVDMAHAKREYPPFSVGYTYGAEQLGAISKSGVYGDATLATAEKGAAMMARFVDEAAAIVRAFRPGAKEGGR